MQAASKSPKAHHFPGNPLGLHKVLNLLNKEEWIDCWQSTVRPEKLFFSMLSVKHQAAHSTQGSSTFLYTVQEPDAIAICHLVLWEYIYSMVVESLICESVSWWGISPCSGMRNGVPYSSVSQAEHHLVANKGPSLPQIGIMRCHGAGWPAARIITNNANGQNAQCHSLLWWWPLDRHMW